MTARPSAAVRFEGGLWDADRGVVIVATERATGAGEEVETALLAIDASTGDVRWRAPIDGMPIAVTGTLVLAALWRPGESALRLWLLRAGDGAVESRSTVPLPSWTALPGAEVTVTAASAEDGSTSVFWHGVSAYAGGAAPPQWVVDEQSRDERGAFVIDPASGAARPVPVTTTSSPPEVARAPTMEGESLVGVVGGRALTLTLGPAEGAALPPGSTALSLSARDASGAQLWRHRIRDVLWRPPPPMPQ